jgi:hypothetical protein
MEQRDKVRVLVDVHNTLMRAEDWRRGDHYVIRNPSSQFFQLIERKQSLSHRPLDFTSYLQDVLEVPAHEPLPDEYWARRTPQQIPFQVINRRIAQDLLSIPRLELPGDPPVRYDRDYSSYFTGYSLWEEQLQGLADLANLPLVKSTIVSGIPNRLRQMAIEELGPTLPFLDPERSMVLRPTEDHPGTNHKLATAAYDFLDLGNPQITQSAFGDLNLTRPTIIAIDDDFKLALLYMLYCDRIYLTVSEDEAKKQPFMRTVRMTTEAEEFMKKKIIFNAGTKQAYEDIKSGKLACK